MQIGQIELNGRLTAAQILPTGEARPVPGETVRSLIAQADETGADLASLVSQRAGDPIPQAELKIPLEPAEVWGCGCTYETSASFRDAEHGTREGFYAYVYNKQHRPEIFLKGTSRICVGPGQHIGMRPDAKFTAPEPELAVVLGARGRIMGYTLSNDVSAWDIERENPLYLPQSKTFSGCVALGPVIVTPEDIKDVYNLEMSCWIDRETSILFEGRTSTARLNRKVEELVEYLLRGNPVPSGTVMMTGTGIIVTEESALAEGDYVSISIEGFGTLKNRAERLPR